MNLDTGRLGMTKGTGKTKNTKMMDGIQGMTN